MVNHHHYRVVVIVQGGIALTSPQCNKKKQTSGRTGKALSVYQTNCETAVAKAAL